MPSSFDSSKESSVKVLPEQVVLIGNYEPDRQYSMQLFRIMLEEGLKARCIPVQTLQPQPRFRRKEAGNRGGKWWGYLDKYLLFPPVIKRTLAKFSGRTILHVCDQSNAVYERWTRSHPRILTCHDLLAVRMARGEFTQGQTRWSGRVLQNWIRNSLERFEYIFCDSDATRQDVERILSSSRARQVGVIPVGMNRNFVVLKRAQALELLQTKGVLPWDTRNYLLHVGGDAWYKNRKGVLAIYGDLVARLQTREFPDLVLVGPDQDQEILDAIRKHRLEKRVLLRPDVPDDLLNALYSAADCLLFPSFAEGFGWPVVEAQACGCPVATSDRPPMSDLAGPHSLLLPPDQPEEAARLLENYLIHLQGNRDTQRDRGLEWIQPFEKDLMVDRYLQEYSRVLKDPNGKKCVS